jgi:signal transduction histidine kinase
MTDIVKHIAANTEEIIIQKEFCFLEELLKQVIDSIELLNMGKNIQIVTSICCDSALKCDKKRVKEALFNIIKNSCEVFGRDAGIIKIEIIKKHKHLICKIADNGKGIPADKIQSIYKPFVTTKSLENNNFGLGLTHCHIVMEQHKGKIEIESSVNEGTCVSLTFPI